LAIDDLLPRQGVSLVPLMRYNPRISREVAVLIERCLAFDPAGRPASAAALAAGLRRALEPAVQRLWVKARPYALAGCGVLGLAAGAASPAALPMPEVAQQVHDGHRLYREGRFQDALACLTRAIDAEPDRSELRLTRGLVYHRLNEPTPAKADLRAAAKTGLSDEAHAVLGYYAVIDRKFDEALGLFARIANPSPAVLNDMAYCWLRLAWKPKTDSEEDRLRRKECWDAADRCNAQAQASDPGMAAAHVTRMWIELDQSEKLAAEHYCPRKGVDSIQQLAATGPCTCDWYFLGAKVCAWAAVTASDDDATTFGKLARTYSRRAIECGTPFNAVVRDAALKRFAVGLAPSANSAVALPSKPQVVYGIVDPLKYAE
jgi:tetratricopeptide (TPR) repeat protein